MSEMKPGSAHISGIIVAILALAGIVGGIVLVVGSLDERLAVWRSQPTRTPAATRPRIVPTPPQTPAGPVIRPERGPAPERANDAHRNVPAAPSAPPAAKPAPLTEDEAWRQAEEANTLIGYVRFITRFPTSRKVDEARRRILKLSVPQGR
ncbi:MAG: hypothetical protein R3D31_09145 [Hyphomicrobiaceae bacterium]